MAPSRAANLDDDEYSKDYPINLDGSREAQSRTQLQVDEEDGFYQALPRKHRWSRILDNLGLMSLRQRHNNYLEPSKTEYNRNSPRFPRSSTVWVIVKQACVVVPVLTLMLFGLLHFMQVLVGRASLLWDIDQDNFLPNWGKTGQLGENVARYPTDATRGVVPVPVHSHNDYWRRIPLFEALHYGCIGVEADVWLFDDDLYVGHNTAALTRNRTFSSLYVDPLVAILDSMNPHTVFANVSKHGVWDTDYEQTTVLLVDLKTDGASTLSAVEQQLEPLRQKGYLTYFDGEKTVPGAITVVGTGNTPFDLLIANTTYRDIFFDAPLEKLWEKPEPYLEPEGPEEIEEAKSESERPGRSQPEHREQDLQARGQGNSGMSSEITASAFNSDNSFYASIDFHAAVGRTWRGHLSPRQIHILRGQIHGAKKRGLKARYWNTPVWPISLRNHVWHILVREGADILNADDLKAAATQDWRKRRHELL